MADETKGNTPHADPSSGAASQPGGAVKRTGDPLPDDLTQPPSFLGTEKVEASELGEDTKGFDGTQVVEKDDEKNSGPVVGLPSDDDKPSARKAAAQRKKDDEEEAKKK